MDRHRSLIPRAPPVQRAARAQAEAALAQAKLNLSFATIISPVDGVVISRAIDVGQTVASSFQAPTMFTIAEDLSRMKIDTTVSESDIGRIKDGVRATFTVDAFPARNFDAVVRQVRYAPTTVSGVVTYNAVIEVDNKDQALKPGMTANVTFVLEEVKGAVKIPNTALRFKPDMATVKAMMEASGKTFGGGRGKSGGAPGAGGSAAGGPPAGMKMGADGPDFGDKKAVWKLVDDKPEMVLVKPGLTDGSVTEMVEGTLKAGDLLIIDVEGAPKAAAGARRMRPGGF